jgi:hypothetical protein
VTRSSIPPKWLCLLAAFALWFGPWSTRAQESAPPTKPAETSADKPATPETPAQLELLETHIRFEANGDSRKEVHTRVRINSELGVRQFSHLNFAFNRSFEQIEIPLVHITHASGGTADILPSAITDQPNPAADLAAYQDIRVKSVRILGLEPADVLEYRVVTIATHPPMAPDFWLDHSFDRTGVVSEEVFELDLPAHSFVPTAGLREALPTPPNPLSLTSPTDIGQIRISPQVPQPSKTQVGEGAAARLVYRWKLTSADVSSAKADSTSGQPDEPDVAITTFASWDQLQRRLQSTLQFHFSSEIWTQATTAIKNSTRNPSSQESAYYDLVSTKVKTVDLPLDFARFQQRAPSEVLASGYGTAEEKAGLFRALTSVRTRFLLVASTTSPEKQLPRPSLLTRILVASDDGKRILYCDPSLEVAPLGMIRPEDRGKKALDLEGNCHGDGCWKTISEELPFRASQRVSVDAALAADGALNAKVKYSMRGDNELLLRIAFHQSPRDKWKEVAQLLALSDGFRGKIISASASDPTVTKLPFTVEYEISETKFVDWTKKPVRIPALLPQLAVPDLPEKAADGAAALSIDLGTPLDVDTRVTLRLPPGTSVEVPTGTVVDRDYATFVSRYNTQSGVITASRHIDFLHRQVPAGQSADYAAFLHAVQTDQSQHFTLSRTDASAHPASPKATTPKP